MGAIISYIIGLILICIFINFFLKAFSIIMIIGSVIGGIYFYYKRDKYTKHTKIFISLGLGAVFFIGCGILNFQVQQAERKKLNSEKVKLEQKRKEEETKIKEEQAKKEKQKILSRFNLVEAKVDLVLSEELVALSNGEHLKFLGVSVPKPDNNSEEYINKVTNYIKNTLENKVVYLEKDNSTTDKAGPLLRCVWLEIPKEINDSEIKSKMFNAKLLVEGYGQAEKELPSKYKEYFTKYNEEAKGLNRGIWAINLPKVENENMINNKLDEELQDDTEDYEDYDDGQVCEECKEYNDNIPNQNINNVIIMKKHRRHHRHNSIKSNKSSYKKSSSGGSSSSSKEKSNSSSRKNANLSEKK